MKKQQNINYLEKAKSRNTDTFHNKEKGMLCNCVEQLWQVKFFFLTLYFSQPNQL